MTSFQADIAARVRSLTEPIVERFGAFLVDLTVRGERSSKVVEVFVDSDTGISIDDCSKISRELSDKLDESDIIPGRYRLDVSSPGLDRPLKHLRQYRKNIGRKARVAYRLDNEQRTVNGTIVTVDDMGIAIDVAGENQHLAFDSIVETVIIPHMK